jgi:hypothetical protein
MKSAGNLAFFYIAFLYIDFCTALPKAEFFINPRRIHSEEEDEEKEE